MLVSTPQAFQSHKHSPDSEKEGEGGREKEMR